MKEQPEMTYLFQYDVGEEKRFGIVEKHLEDDSDYYLTFDIDRQFLGSVEKVPGAK